MTGAALLSFSIYLTCILAIGVAAYFFTHNLTDYLLGGRNLRGPVAALSAGSADMSGWLMMGLPGAAMLFGLNQIWLPIGLIIGAFLNWTLIAKRLRIYTDLGAGTLTLPGYLQLRFHDTGKLLRSVPAFVILFFFIFYISAGLVGVGLLLNTLIGTPYEQALLIAGSLVVLYTFVGGFLGVSWTDFIQGIFIFLALVIVPVKAFIILGGWDTSLAVIDNIDPEYVNVFSGITIAGVLSLLAWGLGYFGQPHILARFMAIRSPRDIPQARFIGISWMAASLVGAVMTGLIGIAYFAGEPEMNTETVFIVFAQILFDPWVTGLLIGAITSAILSTANSQLLVASSVLTDDFYRARIRPQASQRELVWFGRSMVIVVTLCAIYFALDPTSRILTLIGFAWAGFGSAFGSVVLVSLLWKRMTRAGAIAGMIAGTVTVIIWDLSDTGIFSLYEMIPGFSIACLAIIITSLLGKRPNKAIRDDFEKVEDLIQTYRF